VDALLERAEADPLSAVREALPEPADRDQVVVCLRQVARTRYRDLTKREIRIGVRHSGTFP
jgi:hypothetical protein